MMLVLYKYRVVPEEFADAVKEVLTSEGKIGAKKAQQDEPSAARGHRGSLLNGDTLKCEVCQQEEQGGSVAKQTFSECQSCFNIAHTACIGRRWTCSECAD